MQIAHRHFATAARAMKRRITPAMIAAFMQWRDHM